MLYRRSNMQLRAILNRTMEDLDPIISAGPMKSCLRIAKILDEYSTERVCDAFSSPFIWGPGPLPCQRLGTTGGGGAGGGPTPTTHPRPPGPTHQPPPPNLLK